MKNLLKQVFFFLSLMILATSCKKDENKVVFENAGTNPVATTTRSGSIILDKATPDLVVIGYSWTNPNYQFNTGASSQDVNYAVQIADSAKGVFKTFATTKVELTKSYTHAALNSFLIKSTAEGGLGLEPLIPSKIIMRIKSYLGTESSTNPTNLYSNVMKLTVTPYSNDPDLWITGTAVPSGYTNTPPDPQKFVYTRSSNTFALTLPFVPGQEYKLLTISGKWQPQYGGAPATGGALSYNDGTPGHTSDPNAIPTPAIAGNYKLTVSLASNTITVVKQ